MVCIGTNEQGKPLYTLKCDKCGEYLKNEQGGLLGFNSEAEALHYAMKRYKWTDTRTKPNRHYCHACREVYLEKSKDCLAKSYVIRTVARSLDDDAEIYLTNAGFMQGTLKSLRQNMENAYQRFVAAFDTMLLKGAGAAIAHDCENLTPKILDLINAEYEKETQQ